MSLARFMHALRADLPDIDLDFPHDQRDVIFHRLFQVPPLPRENGRLMTNSHKSQSEKQYLPPAACLCAFSVAVCLRWALGALSLCAVLIVGAESKLARPPSASRARPHASPTTSTSARAPPSARPPACAPPPVPREAHTRARATPLRDRRATPPRRRCPVLGPWRGAAPARGHAGPREMTATLKSQKATHSQK